MLCWWTSISHFKGLYSRWDCMTLMMKALHCFKQLRSTHPKTPVSHPKSGEIPTQFGQIGRHNFSHWTYNCDWPVTVRPPSAIVCPPHLFIWWLEEIISKTCFLFWNNNRWFTSPSKQVTLNETSHYVSNHPGCDAVLLSEELLLVQRITVPSSGGYSSLGRATALSCSSSIMNIQNISSHWPITSNMTGNTSVRVSDVIHGSC